jgi:hypothetical protein
LLTELKPGSRIVSHDFDMGDWQPDRQVALGEHTIYFWVVPANMNGAWMWSIGEKGRTHRYELRLRQRFQNVDNAELRVDGIPQAVSNFRIQGDHMEFVAEGPIDDKKQQLLFRGSVKGNFMSGTLSSSLSQKTEKKKWFAERDPSTAIPIEITAEEQIHL